MTNAGWAISDSAAPVEQPGQQQCLRCTVQTAHEEDPLHVKLMVKRLRIWLQGRAKALTLKKGQLCNLRNERLWVLAVPALIQLQPTVNTVNKTICREGRVLHISEVPCPLQQRLLVCRKLCGRVISVKPLQNRGVLPFFTLVDHAFQKSLCADSGRFPSTSPSGAESFEWTVDAGLLEHVRFKPYPSLCFYLDALHMLHVDLVEHGL